MTKTFITEEDKAIGARLRLHRVMAGISQTDLGNAVGVTFQQVQKYENGTNRISGSRLAKAASVLNVSVAKIIGGSEGDASGIGLSSAEARLIRDVRDMTNQDRNRVYAIVKLMRSHPGVDTN